MVSQSRLKTHRVMTNSHTLKGDYMEEWRTVPDTGNKIEVSNLGRVRSLLRGTPYILKTQKDKKGYQRLTVTIKGQFRTYKLHRLVAGAFIENPDNLPQVNHIDGDKDNNAVGNLEWITNRDNARHAISTGLWDSVIEGNRKENNRRKKPIIAYNDTETIEFESVREAEKYFNSRHITNVLKGDRKTCKGYHFRYAKGGDAI